MIARPKHDSERIIVPLDTADRDHMLRLVRELRDKVGMFKVGKELFTALGPAAVDCVLSEGSRVFLDLKYHDIPNTVAGAVRAAAGLGVSMLTVHASGGKTMLQEAVGAAHASQHQICIVAVTVLTSLDNRALEQIGFSGNPQETVIRLGKLAVEAGVAGLVCSPRELRALRSTLGSEPLLVTPGVRPKASSTDDQSRVATPAQAVREGADFLVIGRPITKAKNPASALDDILTNLA